MRISGEASIYGSGSASPGPCTWNGVEITAPTAGTAEHDAIRCWVSCTGMAVEDSLIRGAPENGGHSDSLQVFGAAHGLRFTGNRVVTGAGAQGFFTKDGTSTNVVFSDNLIVNGPNNASNNAGAPFQVFRIDANSADPFYSGHGLVMEHNVIWHNDNISYFRTCTGQNYRVQQNVFDGLTALGDPTGSCASWLTTEVTPNQEGNILLPAGNVKATAKDSSGTPTFRSPTTSQTTGDWRLLSGTAGITWDASSRSYGP